MPYCFPLAKEEEELDIFSQPLRVLEARLRFVDLCSLSKSLYSFVESKHIWCVISNFRATFWYQLQNIKNTSHYSHYQPFNHTSLPFQCCLCECKVHSSISSCTTRIFHRRQCLVKSIRGSNHALFPVCNWAPHPKEAFNSHCLGGYLGYIPISPTYTFSHTLSFFDPNHYPGIMP